jgi:hypothetical protein
MHCARRFGFKRQPDSDPSDPHDHPGFRRNAADCKQRSYGPG